MGLFSFIGKAAKGLLKVGSKLLPGPLGTVAKGASAVVEKLSAQKDTEQKRALIAKAGLLTAPTPTVSRTEGWGFSPKLRALGKAQRTVKRKRQGTPYDEPISPRKRYDDRVSYTSEGVPHVQVDGTGLLWDESARSLIGAAGLKYLNPDTGRFIALAKVRKANGMGTTRARKAKRAPSGKKRAPPKGGLDLKALSASWKAAGKPGTWQGWIKANK